MFGADEISSSELDVSIKMIVKIAIGNLLSKVINFVEQAETSILHCIHWTTTAPYWHDLLESEAIWLTRLHDVADATKKAVIAANEQYCDNVPRKQSSILSNIKISHEHYIFKLERARNALVTTLKTVSIFFFINFPVIVSEKFRYLFC